MMDLVTQARLRDHVIAELTNIGGRVKGDEIIILCAYHVDSRPSLQVHIGHNITPGGFHCFSCGAHGGWNKLAGTLNLKTFAGAGTGLNGGLTVFDPKQPNKLIVADDPFKTLSAVLQKTEILTIQSIHQKQGLEPLAGNFKWKGHNKAFLEKFGAKFFWDRNKDAEFLYFPLTMNNDYVGYMMCSLTPGVMPKYQTFADTHRVFFLYDHVPNNGPIILTEGAGDALRLHAEDINTALAIFGTQNWSPTKKAFLVAKNPTHVHILMDGDKSGYDAAEKIYMDLRAGCNATVHYLPDVPSAPVDPGNMPPEWVEYIRQATK